MPARDLKHPTLEPRMLTQAQLESLAAEEAETEQASRHSHADVLRALSLGARSRQKM